MLETKSAKRRPLAAVKIAVEMEREKFLTEREALLRVDPEQMEYFLHPTISVDFGEYFAATHKTHGEFLKLLSRSMQNLENVLLNG